MRKRKIRAQARADVTTQWITSTMKFPLERTKITIQPVYCQISGTVFTFWRLLPNWSHTADHHKSTD